MAKDQKCNCDRWLINFHWFLSENLWTGPKVTGSTSFLHNQYLIKQTRSETRSDGANVLVSSVNILACLKVTNGVDILGYQILHKTWALDGTLDKTINRPNIFSTHVQCWCCSTGTVHPAFCDLPKLSSGCNNKECFKISLTQYAETNKHTVWSEEIASVCTLKHTRSPHVFVQLRVLFFQLWPLLFTDTAIILCWFI